MHDRSERGALVDRECRTRRALLEDSHEAAYGSARSGGPSSPARGRQGARERAHEVAQRAAVAGQRRDRHPLLRPVVAAADRAELDGRDARLQERDRVRRAVAADRQRLALDRARDRVAQRQHVRVAARDDRRHAREARARSRGRRSRGSG